MIVGVLSSPVAALYLSYATAATAVCVSITYPSLSYTSLIFTAVSSSLTKDGEYVITDAKKAELSEFFGAFGSEEETAVKIKEVYDKEGYVMDTHTAVAAVAYDKYKAATGDDKTPTVIASTASPYKFTRSVMDAIDPAYDAEDDFVLVDELNKVSKTAIPKAIEEIRTAPVLHDTVCETAAMEDEVKKILGI